MPQAALSALVGHMTDESMKGSSYLYEVLTEPKSASSDDPESCATTRSLGSSKALWDYFEQPDQKYRLYRFGVAMEGAKSIEPIGLPLASQSFQIYFFVIPMFNMKFVDFRSFRLGESARRQPRC